MHKVVMHKTSLGVKWCYRRQVAEQQKIHLVQTQKIDVQQLQELEQVLALDPAACLSGSAMRVYKMRFANVDVAFTVSVEAVHICELNTVIE